MRRATWLAFVLLLVAVSSPARIIVFDANQGQGGLHIDQATDSFVEVELRLESLSVEDVEIDGSIVQQISIPGAFIPNDEGAPNMPRIGRYVAKPNGSTASLEILATRTELFEDVDLAPAPNIPFENDNSPLVYVKDASIYTRDAHYPEVPFLLSEPMKMRGVEAVILGITPFQYNPVTRELLVYTDVKVRVNFAGGTGHFGEDRLRSRYWDPILRQHLINFSSLPELDYGVPPTDNNEYDYVIICPDIPIYKTWADSLAKFRTLQGIDTGVFTLTQTGATYTQIESWVNNAYNTWTQTLSAVLLLGDYVPNGGTTGVTAPEWSSLVSDNIYADVDGDDLPDIAFARMTATANDVQEFVTKAIYYERHPPTNPDFYDHPISAGGWQTERWFILCCEVIYGFWENVLGKSPVREYAIYSGTPGSVWSTNSNTWMVVDYFGPDGLGYIPATPAHLTDWGGNATRINNDINSGAFILQHRDHGSELFWGEPYYHVSHFSGLHNDDLTFVFSINCLTGRYDWGSDTFTECFHQMHYGALGLVAASDVSYSFVNDTFVWGIYDAMWSNFMPDYPFYSPPSPTNGGPYLRPGFGHTSGKYFLQQSTWPSNPNSKTRTHHLFHMHGDAYTTLYSEVPQYLTVSHDSTIPEGSTSFDVTADDGSVIGLSVDGELIGVGDGTGSPVTIPIDPPPTSPGEMRVTVTMQNYYRYSEDVDIVAGSQVSPLLSSVTVSQAFRLLFCPGGDADNIVIAVTVRDHAGQPIQGIPAGDIKITVDNSAASYNFDFVCEASRTLLSTQPTDANGQVFIPLERAGGYDPAVELVTEVVNVVLNDRPHLEAKSPDFDASGDVNLVDFAYFASCYGLGAWPADLDYSGTVNLVDFAIFASHYGHNCGSDRTLPIPPDALAEFEAMVKEVNGGEFPQTYALYQNAPNPFNPSTVIEYDVPKDAGHVAIGIYDVSGRLVKMLVDGDAGSGHSAVIWDGTDARGQKVASGVYYSIMEAPDFHARSKMVLLK